MDNYKKLVNFLTAFTTDERIGKFNEVVENRTRYLTVVLEDIFQPQNASAVLRSCECFGIQDVHIIENRNEFNVNPEVALGSSKWIDMHRHNAKGNNTLSAIKKLKAQGYRIVATTPHTYDVSLPEFDLSKGKAALFFGTELTGLSEDMLAEADEFLKIPMVGFTESFNISVSASIVLYQLTKSLRESNIDWRFTEHEKNKMLIKWFNLTLNKPELLISEFCSQEGLNGRFFNG